jgi:hypothetical protein
VIEPVELINDLDATDQPAAYSPARLEGSGIASRKMRMDDLDAVKQTFLNFARAETVRGLPHSLREMLAQPRSCRVHLFIDARNELVGIFGVDYAHADQHRIRVLRIRRGGVSQTLARHLLWRAIHEAVSAGARSIVYDDPFSEDRVNDALTATGFLRSEGTWAKVIVTGSVKAEELVDRVSALVDEGVVTPMLRSDLAKASAIVAGGSAADVVLLEHYLWPLKVKTDKVPCYVVPIRPAYAAALFDTTMASESLFDADENLLLRLENVYYRSARPKLECPARVLWYVSAKGKGYSHAGHVSAASTLTSVAIGNAKTLHGRFRRYGVYTYDDVKRIGDQAMAFTFTQTEMLSAPVTFIRTQEILRRHTGVANPFAGPVRIRAATWFELYAQGCPGRA